MNVLLPEPLSTAVVNWMLELFAPDVVTAIWGGAAAGGGETVTVSGWGDTPLDGFTAAAWVVGVVVVEAVGVAVVELLGVVVVVELLEVVVVVAGT